MSTTRAPRLTAALAATALALPLIGIASAPAQAVSLPSGTATMLQYMVAEEKLAHDVYTTLGAAFDLPIFDDIATSETRHESRVAFLLNRYGITDPTVGDAVGVFDDPQLQALYTQLVATGTRSLVDAAQAGITIEKRDIADLTDALAQPLPADVSRILSNLRRASAHHLAAFEQLEDSLHATGS